HRKKGIGKELLQVCLKDLNDLGPREVELYVWVRNEDAMRFYKAMGFKEHMVGMKLTTAG
ncbi:MAG: GNAT family N-acetyltransferase, partial [Nitrososphaerales archaeon]